MRKKGAHKIGAPLRPRAASQPGVEPSPRSGRRATPGEPPRRDVTAFDERAQDYEDGRLGRLHHNIADRAGRARAKRAACPLICARRGMRNGLPAPPARPTLPGSNQARRSHPSPAMIEMAGFKADDGRLHYRSGIAEPTVSGVTLRPLGEHHLVRPLVGSGGRTQGVRPGIEAGRPLGPGRPILVLAHPDTSGGPPGERREQERDVPVFSWMQVSRP